MPDSECWVNLISDVHWESMEIKILLYFIPLFVLCLYSCIDFSAHHTSPSSTNLLERNIHCKNTDYGSETVVDIYGLTEFLYPVMKISIVLTYLVSLFPDTLEKCTFPSPYCWIVPCSYYDPWALKRNGWVSHIQI